MADNDQIEKISLEFTQAQTSLSELIGARQQLETQFQENKIVLQEFDHLNEDSKIYKLTGPVLMPQDFSEAKMNVNKRIEFIKGEIERAESKIKEQETVMETARNSLVAIRTKMASA
ncbi:hypothetical protein CANTEDRAFT_114996 [Yamadazyma tenuis ATCC 10573]|uniref:Prefoldin n=2 Tax=Candida tenuis TaxID=2315449 RepID=G3BBA1_CANTC|nr:Prefoldin [Yamadazyma tenuis ATCC 10573]XP_006688721.1 uncharacterized protein CANTEDRAFT_114996 [Yamadazyma tenuis ATCC 10573]EGV62550.1 Prefoldin [Yamadazyma tenuis ATCC 10573]EGV62551.1 hypothetical protein CANTEDRAFT_114996 [Yamadazyma tenuis ATCC 10573]